MVVKNVMQKNIVRLPDDATVLQAAKLMLEKDISGVVISKDEKDIGIMTERDISRKVIAGEKDYKTTKVEEVMSSPLITIDLNSSLEHANELMLRKKIRKLIVTHNDETVGIITQRDVARKIKHSIASKIIDMHGPDGYRPDYQRK